VWVDDMVAFDSWHWVSKQERDLRGGVRLRRGVRDGG
jgi:hypothetical protein